MKTDKPLVSIVAVCYNHEAYVKETLDSILNQTYANIQLIIIDDCSTDNSVTIIKSWIRTHSVECKFIVRTKNIGLCKNLNEGLKLSTGKYYQSIACDDVMEIMKIEVQVNFMEKAAEDVMLVCSNFSTIDKNGKLISDVYFKKDFVFPEDVFSAILSKYLGYNILIHSPTVLLRKNVFEKVGIYDESLKQEDLYMWLLIASKFSVRYINKCLVKYRKLENSLSKQFKLKGASFYERTKVVSKFYDKNGNHPISVLNFQLKQVKLILSEGISVDDENMILKGLNIYEGLLFGNENNKNKIDSNLFKVYMSYPILFRNWKKKHNFKFKKLKHQLLFNFRVGLLLNKLGSNS